MTDSEGKCGKYVGDNDRDGLRPVCVRDFGHGGPCEEAAWSRRHEVIAERDALRAENERLRRELQIEREYAAGARDALAEVQAYSRERHAKLRDEAAELRASLADAVGKIAAMERVVVTACSIAEDAEHRGKSMADVEALKDVVRAYEASLPGIVKVKP